MHLQCPIPKGPKHMNSGDLTGVIEVDMADYPSWLPGPH